MSKKQTVVSLDKDQLDWIASKMEEGYSKSGLIRYAIKRLMIEPKVPSNIKELKTKSEDMTEGSNHDKLEWMEIEKILEVLIKLGESGDLNKYNLPDIVETAKSVQEKFRNIDHLSPKAAFELGKFKIESETKFNEAMRRHISKS